MGGGRDMTERESTRKTQNHVVPFSGIRQNSLWSGHHLGMGQHLEGFLGGGVQPKATPRGREPEMELSFPLAPQG